VGFAVKVSKLPSAVRMKFTLPATDVAADAGTALKAEIAQTTSAAIRSALVRLLLENDAYM
jgi:hypothetical protein